MRLLLASALALLAARASAAGGYYDKGYRTGKWDIGLHPGWAIPISKTSDVMGTSWAMTFNGGYQFADAATVGIDWGWQFKHKVHGTARPGGEYAADYDGDGSVDVVPFNSTIHYVIMNLTPFIKVGPWLEGFGYHWRPYGVAGAGFYHEWTNSGTVDIQGNDRVSGNPVGPVIFRRDTSSNSYLGVNVGTGFEVQVDENADVGFDLRYTRIFRPIYDWDFITPSIRVLYLF